MKLAFSLLFAVVGANRAVDAFVPSTSITSANFVVPTGRIANLRTSGTNSCLAMSTGGLPELDIETLDRTKALADSVITSLSSTGVTLPKPDSIDLSALSSLSLAEENSTDEFARKLNEALNEFIAWAQPQVEALADYGGLLVLCA